ncbi:acyl-CoA thioesterase [Martelella endophytica]|uniref:acyl-CoA thioesterase n=1 Tax=Martelella endophytica TaxID=1486262 RepID=UPI0006962D6E|nr:acyl-CoA thioesterase [Martelella endophytica]
MYVWARLLTTLAKAKFAPPLSPPEETSSVVLRVWPHDLDLNLHVNNGRYLTFMDIGRMDLLFRSGLGRRMLKEKWQPVLTGVNARYHRSLGAFQRFRMETQVVGWTEHSLFMEHRIIPLTGPHKGDVAVTATVRALMLEAGRKVTTAEMFASLGVLPESPPLPETCEILLSPEERAALGGDREHLAHHPASRVG